MVNYSDVNQVNGAEESQKFYSGGTRNRSQATGANVMVCDVDGLKWINDTLGHSTCMRSASVQGKVTNAFN